MKAKTERLEKLLSRLGYGSRKDVPHWIREGWITVNGQIAKSAAQKVYADDVLLEGQALDYPHGLTVIYHKPLGSVCSRKEDGRLIYDDFPERWLARKPALSSVGRLDKETSGLLIITDNGQLNHHLTSPKHGISKTYDVKLERPLQGHEIERFASGSLMLEADDTPCRPAELTVLDDYHVHLVLHEGRYHQVRRMFAAVGNHVTDLSRILLGKLSLAQLQLGSGDYCCVEDDALIHMLDKGFKADS